MIIHSYVVIANERDFIYLKEKWNGNYRDKVLDLGHTFSLLLRSCVCLLQLVSQWVLCSVGYGLFIFTLPMLGRSCDTVLLLF